MKKKIVLLAALVAFLMLALTGCFPDAYYDPLASPRGLGAGIWHGMIAIISLIGSFFNSDIAMFDANNNGFWYSLGFFLAVSGEGFCFFSMLHPRRERSTSTDRPAYPCSACFARFRSSPTPIGTASGTPASSPTGFAW